MWSNLQYVAVRDTNHIFRNRKVNLIIIVSIVQTILAVKSFLYSVSLQLSLALSARDNLESVFSYVEEVERNRGWRLQICELQLYSPFPSFPPCLSFSPFGSIPLQQGGRRGGHFSENWRLTWSKTIWEPDPVVFSALTTVQQDSLWHLRCQQKGFLPLHVELIHLFVISIQDLERYKAD